MRCIWRAIVGGAILLIPAAPAVPGGRDGTGEATGRSAIVRSGGFDLDVYVGDRPLEQYAGRGRRYIEAVRGADYEVRITNPSADRVAVVLTVDGLNTIDARRDPAWEASKWVVGPHRSYTLSGWQMSTTRARRFTFTTERDSYAAQLGGSSDPGAITATFFRERRPVAAITPRRAEAELDRLEARGAEEAEAAKASPSRHFGRRESFPGRDDDRAATGIGRSVYHEVRTVDMELEPQPVAVVTIHYKYRPELIRLGVLPHDGLEPDEFLRSDRSGVREDPRFCPEP